ncbi:transcription initiation factor TFIID subunit 7 (TAF7) [Vairimorpha necatrix]|uniref:Transcription initiation factor TFIID subunit 7 (TAF7) n=1 Tax=Vairimorpha necatrix TaxID=6039 RepID=A0AAX4JC48_9MICR
MEQHFILRLKDELKDIIDLKESTLESLDHEMVQLVYKNKKYPGIIVKLPCIMESQKTLDKKQFYKISDISRMVVIFPHNDFDFEKERKMYEMSGLSAPLKYCKVRRFRKKFTGKIHLLNEIEQKVNELLEKDKRAKKVVIEGEETNTADEDILGIVAEIENNLEDTNFEAKQEQTNVILETPEIIQLKREIEQQKSLVDNALNPILQQRFKAKLDILLDKLENMYK